MFNLVAKPRPSVAVMLSSREKFSPYYGGALARWTYEVYSRLTAEMDVTVFGYPTAADDLYPMSHETSQWWRFCNCVAQVRVVRRYEERLWLRALFARLRRYDVIHIHHRPQWVGLLRSCGYKGSIVLHLQNDHLGHWTGPSLDRLAPLLDLLAVCSSYLRDAFAPKSPALAAKTQVVFNGVDTQLFCPREELRKPKTIFFVGRFDREKGVLQLVQAYAQVLKQYPETELIIGGATGFGTHEETAYVRDVRSLAGSLVANNHAHIQFAGYLHHDRDLPSWFQKATIFACPSLFQEPFGLVNAEAMSCATPVVAASRGGIPEVLNGTGCLIDPENIEQFAETLSRLLGQPQYSRQLGRASYERCHRMFDWDLIARRWAILFDRMIAKGQAS
jgi:spore coat protein SA